MTLVENDDIARLLALVGELSSQIAENRERTQALQQQADELKGQAIHSTTGYALRRFNVDISKEKFESELERINAQLVYENNILAHENRQTALLLREYEQALETVMARFRAFTHATQTHTLEMTKYYESLISANVQAAAEAQLQASTSFNGKLSRLGDLVRMALRSVDGEVDDLDEDEDDQDAHIGGPDRPGQPAAPGNAPWSDAQSFASNPSTRSKSTRHRPQAFGSAGTDPRWFGMGGGYTGKDGDPAAQLSEHALERRTEEERLRYENEMLRALLGIQEAKMETGPQAASSAANPSTSVPASASLSKASELISSSAYTNTNAVPPVGTPLLGIRVEEVADADDDDEDEEDDDEDGAPVGLEDDLLDHGGDLDHGEEHPTPFDDEEKRDIGDEDEGSDGEDADIVVAEVDEEPAIATAHVERAPEPTTSAAEADEGTAPLTTPPSSSEA